MRSGSAFPSAGLGGCQTGARFSVINELPAFIATLVLNEGLVNYLTHLISRAWKNSEMLNTHFGSIQVAYGYPHSEMQQLNRMNRRAFVDMESPLPLAVSKIRHGV